MNRTGTVEIVSSFEGQSIKRVLRLTQVDHQGLPVSILDIPMDDIYFRGQLRQKDGSFLVEPRVDTELSDRELGIA